MIENLDFNDSWTVERLIKRVLREKCNCDLLTFSCTRCELLDDAEKLFPREFAKAAKWVAKAQKRNKE